MTSRKLFDSTSEVTVTEAYDCAILSSCGRKKLVICDSVLWIVKDTEAKPYLRERILKGGAYLMKGCATSVIIHFNSLFVF